MHRIATAVILLLATVLPAQSQSQVDVRATFGATKPFLDEPFGAITGASLLVHLGSRFAIGPEFLYSRVRVFHDQSYLATGTYSLSQPNRRIVFYVMGSVGMLRDHDTRIDFTSKELTGSGGAGVRIGDGKGLFVSPEFRLGSHAFPIVAAHLGYSF